jgi:hypothetical protein
MIPIVDVTENPQLGNGSYGRYFLLNKRTGLKMFKSQAFSSADRAIDSQAFCGAAFEFAVCVRARMRLGNVAPSPRYLAIAKWKDRFYPAIVMEHKPGQTLFSLVNAIVKKASGDREFKELLADHMDRHVLASIESITRWNGLRLDDMHSNNVIVNVVRQAGQVYTLKFYIIDFGASSDPVFRKCSVIRETRNIVHIDFGKLYSKFVQENHQSNS